MLKVCGVSDLFFDGNALRFLLLFINPEDPGWIKLAQGHRSHQICNQEGICPLDSMGRDHGVVWLFPVAYGSVLFLRIFKACIHHLLSCNCMAVLSLPWLLSLAFYGAFLVFWILFFVIVDKDLKWQLWGFFQLMTIHRCRGLDSVAQKIPSSPMCLHTWML